LSPISMVTGASSGIGEAYAERLASRGHDLVIVARRAQRLAGVAGRLKAAHGVGVREVVADLSSAADLEQVCGVVRESNLDLLVNNAGLANYGPFSDLDPELASELVGVNVLAPVMLARAALSSMVERRRGAIVNIASLLAFSGSIESSWLPRRAVYAATKSFIVTFSQVLFNEVKDKGVFVQVVCPGVVRSEFHSRQGIDMGDAARMEPELVVEASLSDLEKGVPVSVPGLSDTDLIEQFESSGVALMQASRTTELPERYR
jgi:short-subunit dehydrogenase